MVTFVLSDIVGSTRLWEHEPTAMEGALGRHDAILAGAVAAHRGALLRARGEGDSTFSVFARATDGVAAAYAAQVALVAEPWPDRARLAVRLAVHTGEAVERDHDYVGPTVNRAARLRSVAHGGEVLVSEATARLVVDRLPPGVRLVELGEVRLRDLDRPEPSYAVAGPGLPASTSAPDHRGLAATAALAARGVTPEEADVLDALGDGMSAAEIASRLDVPQRAVERHVASLLRTFGVTEPYELARAAEAAPAAGRFAPAVTSLVDRQAELAGIARLVDRHGLVTLVGAGGTGKTRLATHFASTVREPGAGDWWCVELAAVRGGDDIAEVLLDAVGARAGTGVDASERLVRLFSARHGLLVLDNCEHVRPAVAALCQRLLRAAPGLRILATSREPLGVAGEVLFAVPPLALPGDDDSATIAAAHSVQLFVDRARSYCPDFALGDDNERAVAALCHSLDGLPLAIELAAARITTMTPREIVARLDRRFLVLGHRSDLTDHHRTLRATLDWSYDLLDADEKILLSQLAVFAPGFPLAAVEALTRGTPHELQTLDILSGLIAKSMVVAEADNGTTRFRLLESVRAYGLEKASERGVQDDARRRHLDLYAHLAEELAGPAVVADVDARNHRLAADAANIRLALDHAIDTHDVASTFRLTAAVVDVWCLRGWGGSILRALETVLGRPGPTSPERADAMANAAWSAWSQGRHAKAVAWCGESERCSAAGGDPPVARVHLVRGLSRLLDDGDLAGGVALCERALQQVRRSGHLRRYAHDLGSYGTYLAVAGERTRAATISAEAAALARRLGDRHTLSLALCALGYVAVDADPDAARARFGEVVDIGDPWCTASALWGLGWLDDRAGDDAAAAHRYRRALELWRDTGDRRGIHYAVQGIGILATRAGHVVTAAGLFAGADAAAPDVGATGMPAWNAWRDRHLAALREALDPRELSAGWRAGVGLEPDVLVKEALVEARALEEAEETAP